MGVCITEHDLCTTGIDAPACAGPLEIIIVPTLDHGSGKSVHIMVIFRCRFTTVERALAIGMERIRLTVPILPQALVTMILHHPHRLCCTLIDIEHLSAIFGRTVVEHLARADGAASVGVKLVADGFHLFHVVMGNTFVSTLIEKNTRVVTVIDDGIAHEFFALLPSASIDIGFGITGWHRLNESHTVTALDILLPRCDMHPTDEVATRLYHEVVAVVAEPCRNTHAHARPLVARTLGIAMNHQHPVVEPYLTLSITGLTETRARKDDIAHGVIPDFTQACLNGIEIAVAPTPEMDIMETTLKRQCPRLTGMQRDGLTTERGHGLTPGIYPARRQCHRMVLVVLIAHL